MARRGQPRAVRVLGIDPGTLVMGYGLIDDLDDHLSMIDCGVLKVSGGAPVPERLHILYTRLMEILRCSQPDEMAVEEPFVSRNVRSALAIGRAQAVAMLAAASVHIPVYTYPPARVKQVVANYGGSDKQQIQHMVSMQLGLSSAPRETDATDALAIALCHLREKHLARLITTGD
jgi:crossover junction endodeoxyribonuclease RuvC